MRGALKGSVVAVEKMEGRVMEEENRRMAQEGVVVEVGRSRIALELVGC